MHAGCGITWTVARVKVRKVRCVCCVGSLRQRRNRLVTNLLWTCCGLDGNKSVTSWRLPHLRGSYGETGVMDFGLISLHCSDLTNVWAYETLSLVDRFVLMKGVSWPSCLELSSVSSCENFCYCHHFQTTSENSTVLCCRWHGVTFLLLPVPPIRTLNIRRHLWMFLTFDIKP